MNQAELILAALKIIGMLCLMTAGLLGACLLFKRTWRMKPGKGRQMRVIETCHLGVKKMICLVEVSGGGTLVLAVTRDHIRLLDKIENQIPCRDPQKNPEFSDELNHFSRTLSGTETE